MGCFYQFFFLTLRGETNIFEPQRIKPMRNDIDKILLSSEIEQSPQNISDSGLTDVLVRLKDGKEYTASFFTFENISKTVVRHKKNGKDLYGKYFWFQNMFLIDDCSRSNIELVVNELLEKGDFWGVFEEV